MQKHYELTYIVSIKHTGDDLQKVIDGITTLIKDHQGEITYDNIVGKQRLMYPIKKIHQGTYAIFEFNLPAEQLKDLDNKLKINDALLRHLILTKKQKTKTELEQEQKVQERLIRRKEEELAQTEGRKAKVEAASSTEKAEEALAKTETAKVELTEKKDKGKVSLEDLDKKLDEILTDDII